MDQLVPFAASAATEPFQISTDVEFRDDALHLRYRVKGPIDQLVLPAPVENPQFRDELWATTCLEIFLQQAGDKGYEEWNFSPNGCWAYYHFRDYRQASEGHFRLQPVEALQWIRSDHQLILNVGIPLFQNFVAGVHDLVYGLTAVLQLKSGDKQYWALKHAGERPDFHLAKSFVGKSRPA